MKKSKKVFAGIVAVFLLLLLVFTYDVSKRTTFPGSKGKSKPDFDQHQVPLDSPGTDTLGKF
jgi:hypothetical protein